MAFNWPTFRTRALTAIVFAAVMLSGLLLNQWTFFLLFSVIHFGCWWEYFALMEKIWNVTYHIYLRLGLMLIGYGLFCFFCGPYFSIGTYWIKGNVSLPVTIAGFILLIAGIFLSKRITLRSFSGAALGVFYISLPWGLMIDFYQQNLDLNLNDTMLVIGGPFLPMLVIASIWINDTMAYIVGSIIGRRPLSPISPKKTWEGTIGGIVLSVALVGWLFPVVFLYGVTANLGNTGVVLSVFSMLVALIAAIAGTFGDLLESKLKRKAGVKDSGRIMPGHGGFLDRFDSLLIAVPAVWVFLHLFLAGTLRMFL